MAYPEHVERLKQGVKPWNEWRRQYPEKWPDLSEITLHNTNLSGADLTRALLIKTNLGGADLSGANLSGAMLFGADLSEASLLGTNLSRTNLSEASLLGTNLSRTNLSEASLLGTNLGGADLGEADLRNAHLNGANLSDANLLGANLLGANLSDAKLLHANLVGANLSGASLLRASLNGADLSGVDLDGARLEGADLRNAHLNGANLSGANLLGASLDSADLSGADLGHANLSDASLNGTDLSGASTYSTVFINLDLRSVKGLAKINHLGPSPVALYTVQLPPDGSALHFLRGAGVPDEWVDDYCSHLMPSSQPHPLFISYARSDDAVARRLHADLQAQGVRCWFAPQDLKSGGRLGHRIDEALHLQDKWLLLLSEHAVKSDWVADEVDMARAKEQQQRREILFPVRLDESVMQTTEPWAANLRRTRYIGDFTGWKDYDTYQKAFDRLLRDLKKDIK